MLLVRPAKLANCANRWMLPGALLLSLCVGTGCSGWKHNDCLSGPIARYDIGTLGSMYGAEAPDHSMDDVVVRSLGGGGVYLEWKGSAVIVSPAFTRLASGNPYLEPDDSAIKQGLQTIDKEKVQALLIGTTRSDRIVDVVTLANMLPNADIYVNESGKNLLAQHIEALNKRKGSGEKKARLKSVNGKDHPKLSKEWAAVRGVDGNPVGMRIRAVELPSDASDTLTEEAEYPLDEYRALEVAEGTRFAYAIEMLEDDGKLAFRTLVVEAGAGLALKSLSDPSEDEHPDELKGDGDDWEDDEDDGGQDWSVEDLDKEMEEEEAAAEKGDPNAPPADGRTKGIDEFEAVIISVRGHLAEGVDPTSLYQTAKAGHVVLIDYDDRTKAGAKKLKFAKEVKGKDAAGMVCSTEKSMGHAPWERRHPDTTGKKGLRSKNLSMPLPGEWLVFATKPEPPPEPEPEPEAKAEEEAKAAEAKKPKKKKKKKPAKKKKPKPADDDEDIVVIDD